MYISKEKAGETTVDEILETFHLIKHSTGLSFYFDPPEKSRYDPKGDPNENYTYLEGISNLRNFSQFNLRSGSSPSIWFPMNFYSKPTVKRKMSDFVNYLISFEWATPYEGFFSYEGLSLNGVLFLKDASGEEVPGDKRFMMYASTQGSAKNLKKSSDKINDVILGTGPWKPYVPKSEKRVESV